MVLRQNARGRPSGPLDFVLSNLTGFCVLSPSSHSNFEINCVVDLIDVFSINIFFGFKTEWRNSFCLVTCFGGSQVVLASNLSSICSNV